MKPLACLLLTALPLLGATIEAPSTISAVSVYADRARVTRTASFEVPEGEQVIRFSGLPAALDDSSVQASGTGTGVKILGIEIRKQYSAQVINDQVRGLQDQLQALNDTARELELKSSDLDEQRNFIGKVREGLVLSGNPQGQIPPQGVDKVKPLYDFYSSEETRLSKEQLANEIATRDLQPKKDALNEEVRRLQGNGARAQKEILVAVKASGPASAKLALNYNMMGASWQPLYDARVSTKDGAIDLSYYGVVRQRTGEDWKDVTLTLSTARPSVGARMPELQPWWVQFVQPATYGMAAPAAAPQMFKSARNDLARDQVSAESSADGRDKMDFETATIDTAGISTTFEIKIPSSIPSDGEPHRVAITTQKFDGQLEYVTTPKLAELAYLKTRLTNSSGAPILGGKVNLFRDGDFVGESQVNFIAPGADFDFFLGVDDGIKVTRKTLADRSAQGGLIQKRKEVTRKYEITVENFRSQAARVTVLDQVPVSQDGSITVSDAKFSEAPGEQDKDTGKLKWVFSLDPKAKKVITEEFTVSWPADKDVSGF